MRSDQPDRPVLKTHLLSFLRIQRRQKIFTGCFTTKKHKLLYVRSCLVMFLWTRGRQWQRRGNTRICRISDRQRRFFKSFTIFLYRMFYKKETQITVRKKTECKLYIAVLWVTAEQSSKNWPCGDQSRQSNRRLWLNVVRMMRPCLSVCGSRRRHNPRRVSLDASQRREQPASYRTSSLEAHCIVMRRIPVLEIPRTNGNSYFLLVVQSTQTQQYTRLITPC